MSPLTDRLTATLASRTQRQILRTLTPNPLTTAPNLVDFSSNDYLSLSQSPLLRTKFLTALSQLPHPYGPPSSRLLDGNTTSHLELEARLAAFFRGEAGLLFNSGFDANVGIWSCLPAAEDYVVYDALVHASIHDGMRASRVDKGKRRAFKHNSVRDLREKLERICSEDRGVREGTTSVWVAMETLYSMDGDLAPLKEIVRAVEECLPKGNGQIVVDEAHSTGLYGPQGRGVVCALGLANRIAVRLHTFGKALACSGGVVLCSPLMRSYLTNYARPLIYSTVMPRMNVVAMAQSLGMLEQGHGDQGATHVHALSSLLLQILSTFLTPSSSPVSLPPTLSSLPPPPTSSTVSPLSTTMQPMLTTSPIIPLLTPAPRLLSTYLIKRGFLVRPITYPTVPKGEERVRVCLHAGNSVSEVKALAGAVRDWVASEEGRNAAQVAAKL